ncbi:hypothetical protein AUQ37_04340 [Candidatus Methanomethylophilus sp. 1R26]|uniref:hypothetical protein n=1 Tax=Candidatus Methanomethylophilus sp. 1R26 TaxID=1769296 RepID=UPI000736597A|nr:hypothetical protein [Candidatus Methanomethylophilus sp. 1R26]KUE74345.1 hypothetical protein AUQ37_04340 [Candidatus Methanomethylophilus sp. 1R26]TQS78805.1 MAG: hypothetical protein A3Q59_00335 [Methanomethylophilus alvi]
MDTGALVLNIGIVIISITAVAFMIRDFKIHRDQFKAEMKVGGTGKTLKAAAIFNVCLFFDVLGIGSYGPITACLKTFKVTRDKYIPGTLQVACVVYQMIVGVYFITNVDMDLLTLAACIIASAIGAYLGSGLVSKLNLNKIRLAMGIALLVVAAVLVLGLAGLTSFDGTETGLDGWKLILITVISFFLGALMTIGIGCYAPLMACVSLLGMDPIIAFPVMMGSCAYIIPAAAIRFCQESARSEKPTYDRKVAVIGSTIGLFGPLVAMFFVTSLPLFWLKILVIVVLLYVSGMMLYQVMHKTEDKVAMEEDAELERQEGGTES